MKKKFKELRLEVKDFKIGDIVIGKYGHPYYILGFRTTLIHKHEYVVVRFLDEFTTTKFYIHTYDEKKTVLREIK